jgi:hypothetical protein
VDFAEQKKGLRIPLGRRSPKTRQLLTFPGVPGIISSRGFNDRVRDGNGWDPSDIITRNSGARVRSYVILGELYVVQVSKNKDVQ